MTKPFPGYETPLPRCGIAVMAKASIPGRAKTRLVPLLTFEEVAGFNIIKASYHVPIAGYMAFGPPSSIAFFKQISPAEIGLVESRLPEFRRLPCSAP